MTRHTPETVRAACERAGIKVADGYPRQVSSGAFYWQIDADGPMVTARGGHLRYNGTTLPTDHYHANEQRAEAMTEDEAARASLSTTLGTATFAIDPKLPRYLSFTTSDGKRVDRMPLDRIAELEERVRVLHEALGPFAEAELPDEDGAYGFERGPMINARAALAATEEK